MPCLAAASKTTDLSRFSVGSPHCSPKLSGAIPRAPQSSQESFPGVSGALRSSSELLEALQICPRTSGALR
eukprot:7463089-Alexandrium_andersonii.AAC.1